MTVTILTPPWLAAIQAEFGTTFKAQKVRKATTEVWIIFAVAPDGRNRYLTLAVRAETAAAISERIRECFAEFPEIATEGS